MGLIVLSRLNSSGGADTLTLMWQESLGDGDALGETQVRHVYGDDWTCFTQTVPLLRLQFLVSLSHVPLFKKLSCEKERIIVSLATMGPQKFSSILNSADSQGDVCSYPPIFFNGIKKKT